VIVFVVLNKSLLTHIIKRTDNARAFGVEYSTQLIGKLVRFISSPTLPPQRYISQNVSTATV